MRERERGCEIVSLKKLVCKIQCERQCGRVRGWKRVCVRECVGERVYEIEDVKESYGSGYEGEKMHMFA